MSYTALYRKFRPQSFEDVKGQEHIVTTLRNQIKADRIGHAYLFTGTRGTGKTSVAKIFARAVNCEHPLDGSPCGECDSCRAIREGASLNVIEIDAASNNGVDNIRQIREEVAYRPAMGRFKVYIIDEVHMLSQGAFNALLKTLEEPPSYVIFILATTEPNKIPITILSRCQRYDFRRISIDTIARRLSELMAEEGVEAEERALRYVAKAGDGSMRDSLSLLDQCISFYMGEKLTYDNVLDVLGAVDTEVFSRMLRCIIRKNVVEAIRLLEELIMDGRELGQFVADFVWYLRSLLLLQSSEDMEDVLDMSAENLEALRQEADMVAPDVLIRYIRIFSELGNQLRYATQKRILTEIALIRLCHPQMDKDYESVVDRLESIEHRLDQGLVTTALVPAAMSPELAVPKSPALPRAVPEEIQEVIRNWRSILLAVGSVTGQFLEKGIPSLGSGGELILVFEDLNAYNYLNEDRAGGVQLLKKAIADRIGREVEVLIQKNETGQRAKDIIPDLRNIHFEIEEDN